MRTADLFEETFLAVGSNKVRSGLTVLGIVIGIGSVIAMVAVGAGAQASVQSSIQAIGANLIIVTPGVQRGVGANVSAGRGTAQTLTQRDADAIEGEIRNIKAVAPELSRRYQVAARGKNTNTQITGTTPAYPSVRNVSVDTGSFFADSQVQQAARVAVLGPSVRDDLFGAGADPIGQSIRIGSVEFKVIGMTKAKGGSGFNNPDDVVYVPITAAQRFLAGDAYVSTVSVSASGANVMSTVQQDITGLLLRRHKIPDPAEADFNVINQADIVSAASSVTGVFTALLASIAGISLLVGGIGIMNMMLTTVTERTREIGLRKAIGAQEGDITLQFLAEAVLLTCAGGLVGVCFGWVVSRIISSLANVATSVSLGSVGLAVGVSAGIGIIFGYYPARRAAKLNPIEALRYE